MIGLTRPEQDTRQECVMFADAVSRMAASIFPIFFAYEEDGRATMGISGTGFFVDDSGLFITVDHLMKCAPASSTYYYFGTVPDELRQPPIEIEEVASDPGRDLYLGRVPREEVQAVALSSESVRPGDYVCLSGYPLALLAIHADGGFVGNVRRYWQSTFVIDATQAVVERRVYDGYIVDHPCFSGMSGGPCSTGRGRYAAWRSRR